MDLPQNKTKIVCTIGPASESLRSWQTKKGRQAAISKEGMLPEYCRTCEYQFECFGECPKNRFIKTPEGEPGLNYLGSGWEKLFAHIDPSIQKIVRRLGQSAVRKHRLRRRSIGSL